MKSVFCYFVVLWLLSIQVVLAEFIETPMTQSHWKVKNGKTECALTHEIPNYGTAGFLLEGSHPLVFYLKPRQSHLPIVKASLSDRASAWMHGNDSYHHYEVSLNTPAVLNKAPQLVVRGAVAERMFKALSKGRIPTFAYMQSGGGTHNSETRVAISSVNFIPAYEQFISCRQQKIPFGIDDLQDHVLYFDFHSKTPSLQTNHFFRQIGEYLQAVRGGIVTIGSEIPAAEKSFGKKWFNSRFKNIKSRLIKAGINPKSIKKKHSLPNGFNKKSIRIRLSGPEAVRTYYYASNQSGLTRKNKSRLNMLVRYFLEHRGSGKLIIKSHTDSFGSRKSNKLLSTKRAVEIKRYLQSKGVNADQIVIHSHGESKPVFSNRSQAGRAKNRRVVIDLVA